MRIYFRKPFRDGTSAYFSSSPNPNNALNPLLLKYLLMFADLVFHYQKYRIEADKTFSFHEEPLHCNNLLLVVAERWLKSASGTNSKTCLSDILWSLKRT